MWAVMMLALCATMIEGMRPSECKDRCKELHEHYVNNVNPCNMCEKTEACDSASLGGPGCDCVPGYYRNKKKECVKKEACEPVCGHNEVFLECSCERTCCNGGRQDECKASCKKGCFCKAGFVRDGDKCIKLEECGKNNGTGSPPTQCPQLRCREGCILDEKHEPCPRCVCSGSPPTKCPKLKCRAGCKLESKNNACPHCSCPDKCGPHAKFLQCGSACAPTCANRYKKNWPCTQQCVRGCFCEEGYLKNKDGMCVKPKECEVQCSTPKCAPGCRIERHSNACPSCKCPKKCGKNEMYLDCGLSCPPTCASRMTKRVCTRRCAPKGCYCKKGFYKNDNGKCVTSKQCEDVTPTPKSCGSNEVYKTCGTPCPAKCENRFKEYFKCPERCVADCFCRDGFVRNADWKCVKPETCPPECRPDQQYYQCVPSCGRTCDAYKRKPKLFCSQLCRPGCFCKEGYYETKDRKCVPPSQCPAVPPPQICPRNEVHIDCVIPCNDCETKGKCNFLVCNKGCDCKKGYYRDSRRNCVPENQCPKLTPTQHFECGKNEKYYRCIPTCKNTCENYASKSRICSRICIEGCGCKKGYVKNSNGKCIKPTQCKKSPTNKPTIPPSNPCRLDKEVGPCRAAFKRYFYNYRTRKCEKFIYGGCRGNGNNFETIKDCQVACGGGLPPVQCSIPFCPYHCRIDYTTKPCPSCSCTTAPPPASVCLQPKRPGRCYGRFLRWFYNQKSGQCEKFTYGGCDANKNNFQTKKDCDLTCGTGPTSPPKKCRKDEKYYECVPNCHNTCDTYNIQGPCPLYCKPGCFCKEGMVQNKNRKCVLPSECPPPTETPTSTPTPRCGPKEQYYDCVFTCGKTCATYNKKGIGCSQSCAPGCFCIEGLVKNDHNECVKPSECNSVPPTAEICTAKYEKYYDECAPSCTGTCRAYLNPGIYHCPRCLPGCWCIEGFYKNNYGVCVPPKECGSTSSPTPPPISNPICQQPKVVGKCKALMRRFFYNQETGQCEVFYYGGCGGNKNNFNSLKKCQWECESETPTPTPRCGPKEQYYKCVFTCGKTCATYNKKGIGCAQSCAPGCFCIEGLVKNDHDECVKPSECNSVPPTENPEKCGENEQYYHDCAPKCTGTCEAHNNPGARYNCPLCKPGCWCSEGLVKRSDGQCVAPAHCNATDVTPTPVVPPKSCKNKNEEYKTCGPACPPKCQTLFNEYFVCPKRCVSGCFCIGDLVRNAWGECVKSEKCPPVVKPTPSVPPNKCDKDEEYLTCGTACPTTCATLNRKDLACSALCVSGCFCKKGLVRNNDRKCIKPEMCPQTCGLNEEVSMCAKPKTCNTCLIRGNCKLKKCEKGCDCKFGYYRDAEGKCIPQHNCPGGTSPPSNCPGENEEMSPCAKPNWCNTCGIRGNCKLKECSPGCDCKSGYYRIGHDGKCIPQDQCPGETTKSPPGIQCSMPKCDEGCMIDWYAKPCPSCKCGEFPPEIQCSIPKCDPSCPLDYSTKPCPSCKCNGNSNTNPGNMPGTDESNSSYGFFEESFSSSSETDMFESDSISQYSNARERYSDSGINSDSVYSESSFMNEFADYQERSSDYQTGSGSWFSENSSGNVIDSSEGSGYSSMSSGGATEWSSGNSSDSENSSSRFSSGSRSSSTSSKSDESSAENEIDFLLNSQFSESYSISDSEDSRRRSSRSLSDSESWVSEYFSDDEIDSENSQEESVSITKSSSTSSETDESSSDIEIDYINESEVYDISSNSDSGYSSSEVWSADMSDASKSSGSRTWSSNDSGDSVAEDASSTDGGSGHSRFSSGSLDWSKEKAADSEKSSLQTQSGSRSKFLEMSSDFNNGEEEQVYEESDEEEYYEMDEEIYKGSENESESYSVSWTEEETNGDN